MQKKSAETEKTGSVEIRPEHNHLTDHNNNNKALIAEIQAGTIDKNTVIAIERKQYGENLGMKDVIKIANILEHNEKNPDNPLKLPEELENTPIFQDALLYKVAKEKGIKVISLEGRNLEHTKGSALYKENREQYMTEVISEVRSKGYNIVASVGSSHVANLENALEITKQNNNIIGFDKIPRKLQKEESIIDKQTETGTSIEILPKEIKQTALNIGNSISQQIDSNPSVKQTKPSKTWVEQLTESSKINKNSVGREA
ncbi:hypothetical protein [Rickettsia endosymbiont of Ceutorhynchus obstrictus]|uniref:hypothetical protein n=1 Tax=Rickettsia endosymbiont of Ceutorhynchus obstrictus TaxID=3066249 RepID=UPI003132F0C5